MGVGILSLRISTELSLCLSGLKELLVGICVGPTDNNQVGHDGLQSGASVAQQHSGAQQMRLEEPMH